MSNILYLVHRLPYPPNKGDKLRSYHLLKHLASRHQVFLGTFIDDPEDVVHREVVRSMCSELYVGRIRPTIARFRSLDGLLSNESLTVRYYRDAGMKRWVDRVCREQKIDAAVVFSSSMAQYVEDIPRLLTLVDFVDVDSAKWAQYGKTHSGPKAWIYAREGERLLAYERQIAAKVARSFFVTDKEADLFRSLAPECAIRVDVMCNGVDSEFFRPDPDTPNPFPPECIPLVFTGAMDYHPNADAVKWFAMEVLPLLMKRRPGVVFYIVGRNPAADVRALESPQVRVTGTVPDVRPYLQHAAVVVASLRIARGVQNKILEAMAMSRPVVASAACAGGVDAVHGRDFIVADGIHGFTAAIESLLSSPRLANTIGRSGRQQVLDRYSWAAHMSRIDHYLDPGVSIIERSGTVMGGQ